MSDSVQPQRRKPTRLSRPWDSPGKNTGVGCQFLLQCRKVKSESEVAQSCLTLSDPTDCSPPGSSLHGIFQAGILEWGAIAFSHRLLEIRVDMILYGGGVVHRKWKGTWDVFLEHSCIICSGYCILWDCSKLHTLMCVPFCI